jgi:hypothetical protein
MNRLMIDVLPTPVAPRKTTLQLAALSELEDDFAIN